MLGIKTSEGAHSPDKKDDVNLSDNSGGGLNFGGQSKHPLWAKQKDLECEVDWILNACTAPHPDKGDRTQPCAPQVILRVEHLAFYVLTYLNYIYHRMSRSWSADLSFKKWEEEEGMPEDHELKGAWHADYHQEEIQHNHWACWKGPAGKIVRTAGEKQLQRAAL